MSEKNVTVPVEPAKRHPMDVAITEFMDGYECDTGEGIYQPTKHEQWLIDDAIRTFIESDEFKFIAAAPSAPQAEQPSAETKIQWLELELQNQREFVQHFKAKIDQSNHEFKNFHRMLCERFDYFHDEVDWKRDQLSLVEHITNRFATTTEAKSDPSQIPTLEEMRELLKGAQAEQPQAPNMSTQSTHRENVSEAHDDIVSTRHGCSRCGAHPENLTACRFGHADCVHFQPDARDKLNHVWRVTYLDGSTCHFGVESTARVSAGKTGKVAAIALRDLRLVETRPTEQAQDERELPPLPEPFDRLVGHPAEGAPVFTADQMRKYAITAYQKWLHDTSGDYPDDKHHQFDAFNAGYRASLRQQEGDRHQFNDAVEKVEGEQQAEPIKDHVIAQTVNQLRDVAIRFHDAQQLRERIAHVIVPLLRSAQAQPQQLSDDQLLQLFFNASADGCDGFALYEVTPGDMIRFARAILAQNGSKNTQLSEKGVNKIIAEKYADDPVGACKAQTVIRAILAQQGGK